MRKILYICSNNKKYVKQPTERDSNLFKDSLTMKPIEESGIPKSFISMLNMYLNKN